jgi:hypothetical protein
MSGKNWKVEDHEMDTCNRLAGKIDAIAKDKNSPKLTTDEVVEFLSIWDREILKNDDPWVLEVTKYLNDGDNGILFK